MSDDPLRESRDTGTFAALLGLVVVSAFFLGLIALVIPDILWLVLVVAAFGGSVALQYLAWGWWLPRVLKDDDAPQERSPDTAPRQNDE
jgi:hypothetical protein